MKRFLLSILTMLLLPYLISCSDTTENGLRIDVLEVGKADCIVIRSNGKTIMIDTGEEENLPEIEAYLKANRISVINYLILSHYDKDHIGGAKKIISSYKVEVLMESSFVSDRIEYQAYHDAAKEKSTAVTKLENNTDLSIGDIFFSIYTPKETSYDKKEDNNASLIVSLKYKNHSFLFCGDALDDRMDEILGEDLGQFNLVKLPHHGSFLNRYDEILTTFACTDVIITDSDKNPADEKLLDLLTKKKIGCYETRYGTVSVVSDGNNISINQ